jgi:hypothetical protein
MQQAVPISSGIKRNKVGSVWAPINDLLCFQFFPEVLIDKSIVTEMTELSGIIFKNRQAERETWSGIEIIWSSSLIGL